MEFGPYTSGKHGRGVEELRSSGKVMIYYRAPARTALDKAEPI